jgi:nucleotidyltransferase substrate binding protein (TIGR01987 family)
MDNTLNLKLQEFQKALATLEEALREKKTKLIRDSVIKRFEYAFELCWKTAKVLLSEKFGIDVFSPKECFRELRRNKFISDQETEMLLKMTDDRNEIIHSYSEAFSNEVYGTIKENYFRLIKKVYQKIEDYLSQ